MKVEDVKALQRHYELTAEELRWKVRDSADRALREEFLRMRDIARALDTVVEDAEDGKITGVEV